MIIFWATLVCIAVFLGVGLWLLAILLLARKINLVTTKKSLPISQESETSVPIKTVQETQKNQSLRIPEETLSYIKALKSNAQPNMAPVVTFESLQSKPSIIYVPIQPNLVQNKSRSILSDPDGLVYFSLN